MMTILIVVQVLLAIAMTGMILVQRGKGAAAGSAFGGGASGTVFGSQGSANFLSRTTAVLATGFFVVSLVMAVIAGRTVMPSEQAPDLGVMDGAPPAAETSDVPVLPESDGGSAADLPVIDDQAGETPADAELPQMEDASVLSEESDESAPDSAADEDGQ